MIYLYGIPTCGTYKKAVAYFTEKGIPFEEINYREHPLTKAQIKQYHELSGLEIKKFFNTSGKLYRELGKDKLAAMRLDELYELFANEPMLIKRPLLVDGDYVRTGFKLEEYEARW